VDGVFIWLALCLALLRAFAPYFQSLKRKTSLAPVLRNRVVSLAETKPIGLFTFTNVLLKVQKKEEV
jgi:hypothetical protein